jgi:hypothetical protein
MILFESFSSIFKKHCKIYSDFTWSSIGASVLRNTFNFMPGIIGEAFFLSNKQINAKELIEVEAHAYCNALKKYASLGIPYYKLLEKTKSLLVLNLDDGLGGYSFKGLKVFNNNQKLDHEIQNEKLIIAIGALKYRLNNIKILGQNKLNSPMHPKIFQFNKSLDPKLWEKHYSTALALFEKLKRNKFDKILAKKIILHLEKSKFYLDVSQVRPEIEKKLIYLYKKIVDIKNYEKAKNAYREFFVHL